MDRTGPVSYYTTCPPDWSAGVTHAGAEQCEPGHAWQGVRDHYLLHYVCTGHGVVRSGRRCFRLDPGDAFLYPPGAYLDYTADQEEPWRYLWVGFRGVHADDLIAPLGVTASVPVLRMRYSSEIESTLNRIIRTVANRDPGPPLRPTALLYELFALLADECASGRPVRITAAELVREAKVFVSQNFQREIDVADVIRHIGIDRSHFSRVFRRSEGGSLQEYLIRTRMERARRLIEETDLSIRAIAASVGYRNYPTFERRYRAHYGHAPSAARRQR